MADKDEWFNGQLKADHIAVNELLAWLGEERTKGAEDVDAKSVKLQTVLKDKGLMGEALQVLRQRASWHKDNPVFRRQFADEVVELFSGSADDRAFVQSAGFGSIPSMDESFRRLEVLRSLKPGVLCYDKTWGAGSVKRVDPFYKRVEIDFDRRANHQLSLAYAGEALRIVDEKHLMVMRRQQPEVLRELVRTNPLEVVKITLRSFGQMSVIRLQELLVPAVVLESDWKRFWEVARKGLKEDPTVDLPSKRNEPLRLIEAGATNGDSGVFHVLARERNMKHVLELVETIKVQGIDLKEGSEQKRILGDRLAFVLNGAEGKHPDLAVRAVIWAKEFGVGPAQLDVAAYFNRLFDQQRFVALANQLVGRDLRALLVQLRSYDAERTDAVCLKALPFLFNTALTEVMDSLLAGGRDSECTRVFREMTVEKQTADVEMIYWLFRHEEQRKSWGLGRLADLARWAVRVLEKQACGDKLKTQKMLRAQVERKDLLQAVLQEMRSEERRDFFLLAKNSPGWDTVDKRSLLANMIKMYPELQALMALSDDNKRGSENGGAALPKSVVTSWRSFRERQGQLEKIVKIEIPEAAKEIAHARSYGDLRENFEYKAAKDKQDLLMRRRSELEVMLSKVMPTDFNNTSADRVTQGTGVKLRYQDGREEVFYILGAWDRDEGLGIIASDSRLAISLQGRQKGEQVPIPTEKGESICTLLDVMPLSEPVRAWISG